MAGMRMERSDWWRVHLIRLWDNAICCALFRLDMPPEHAIFVDVMGRKSECYPLARGCMLVLRASGGNTVQCTRGNGQTVQCTCGNRFQCTRGSGQTVQCTRGNGNTVMFPRGSRNMFLSPSPPPFLFPWGTAQSADGACGGGGGIDSCSGCDAVSTATYGASAVSEMGTSGDALSKTTCAASAVSGKCQRRGPVSSRHPARMGCPSG